MEKLRFEFTILPGSDGKTNIYCVTSITTSDNKIYAIPEELQSVGYHKEILKTAAYSKVKNSLTKRYQIRRVWITMTEELKKNYIDEDGNIQFGDQYLEELNEKQPSTEPQKDTDALGKLLEKLIENTQENRQQSLKNIAEKFVIEKFSTKNSNAVQWIDIFERECERFQIADEKKVEILRLFMDKSCADWFSSMIIKLTMDADWSKWKKKFCDSFANKGWNPVTNAMFFKYKDGSLLDYAIKKEKLLLDMRRSIDAGTLVDLIASGLPEYIINKIDREILNDTVDLFNEVSKLEHMVNRKSYVFKRRVGSSKTSNKNEDLNACKICEKLNKGPRYHPENLCWFRTKDEDKNVRNVVRHVNNSVIEAELNETHQKNE
ncbi:uncharacterized protein LOC133516067 [Cydia pomonella]|uniref:uncharacterized protein LOC133516067 n=1 Tax=Cydia pomonella TaxID=82600 RepID=UPI002ADD7F2A|nr:uncharacterized protein LOC133516067 [Cydia pomonella]